MDLLSYFTKVFVHDRLEEVVIFTAEDYFLHLWPQMVKMFQVYSIVIDSHQLVYHGLVCPLIEKRCDWILFSVQDKKQGLGRVTTHSLDKILLRVKLVLNSLGNVIAQGTCTVIPDQWI